jgi:phenylacetate-CoA ligase
VNPSGLEDRTSPTSRGRSIAGRPTISWALLGDSKPQELQAKKLKYRLKYAWERSTFYRNLWERQGVTYRDLCDIESIPDMRRLIPTIDKEALIQDQISFPPFGQRLTVSPEEVVAYSTSGGTSGGVLELQPMTRLDVARASSSRAAFGGHWMAGLRPGGSVPIFFPVSASGGTWFPLEWSRRMGATRALLMHTPTSERLEELARWRISFMGHMLPSYLNILSSEARSAGFDPTKRLPHLRGIVLGGESYPLGWAERMSEFWGCTIHSNYGSTQGFGLQAWTCERGAVPDGERGVLHHDDLSFVMEIIDPETCAPVNVGDRGELVVTTLDNMACPYIRFRTGDSAVNLGNDACPCGRQGLCLEAGTIGRLDDQVKIKGTNVRVSAIEAAVFHHSFVDDFRLTISSDRSGRTFVHAMVRPRQDTSMLDDAETTSLASDLQRVVGSSVQVEFTNDVLHDPQNSRGYRKIRRLVDQRELEF